MVLQQFERRLERLVEGVFARTFRSGLQPVEIGRRLTREMDLYRTVGIRGLITPNEFVVAVSPEDAARFEPFAEGLVRELGTAARDHARSEHYGFLGPVEVRLETDKSLPPGMFLLAGSFKEGPGGGRDASLVLPDGRRIPIGTKPVVVGRLHECSIVVEDANVSRRHAEIRWRGDGLVLTDLSSTNGTKVNGVAVHSQELNDGDKITMGRTTLAVEVL
jgi:Protein of unknown function (DUF3662)/FHA domain